MSGLVTERDVQGTGLLWVIYLSLIMDVAVAIDAHHLLMFLHLM
jgi:hypothetical protein